MGIRQAVVGVIWLGVCLNGWAQVPNKEADVEETRAKMTALRDAFVQSVKDAGFTCPIAVPPVLVEDVPSFGSYDPEMNTPADFRVEFVEAGREPDVLSLHGAECDGGDREERV